jgi:hypothetical protein
MDEKFISDVFEEDEEDKKEDDGEKIDFQFLSVLQALTVNTL